MEWGLIALRYVLFLLVLFVGGTSLHIIYYFIWNTITGRERNIKKDLRWMLSVGFVGAILISIVAAVGRILG